MRPFDMFDTPVNVLSVDRIVGFCYEQINPSNVLEPKDYSVPASLSVPVSSLVAVR